MFVPAATAPGGSIVSIGSTAAPMYHLILQAFRDDASSDEIDAVMRSTMRLDEIDGVQWALMGPHVTPAQRDRGFTHATLLALADKTTLLALLQHPLYVDLRAQTRALVARTAIVDLVRD